MIGELKVSGDVSTNPESFDISVPTPCDCGNAFLIVCDGRTA